MRLTWYWDELDNFDRHHWQNSDDIRSVTATDASPGRPAWLIVLHPEYLDRHGDPAGQVWFYGAPLSSVWSDGRPGPIPPVGWEGWRMISDSGDTFYVL